MYYKEEVHASLFLAVLNDPVYFPELTIPKVLGALGLTLIIFVGFDFLKL
jgi:hypothetical protein